MPQERRFADATVSHHTETVSVSGQHFVNQLGASVESISGDGGSDDVWIWHIGYTSHIVQFSSGKARRGFQARGSPDGFDFISVDSYTSIGYNLEKI
jgi:hypothetical protein